MRHDFPFVWFLVAFAAYTALLFLISWITGRKAGSNSFFSGDKKAPWPVVAYGMIGASISGVTFISVPGNVWVQNFFYMPLVLGFVGGYIIIAKVLLHDIVVDEGESMVNLQAGGGLQDVGPSVS